MVLSERDGRNFSADGPIGTGPYVVTSFTKERAELAANENYWDGEYSLFTNNKDYTVTEASSLRDVMARI